ncbi:MAG: nucleotidyl transferase AbiEii/AbiGii toxin family protein [Actinomycetota bacterium]
MIPVALVRRYAQGQQVAYEVADQEVVLHYALALLAESGITGYRSPGSAPGPLLFKGGTALRKCVFGSTGRFSQDIDLDAAHENGFEAAIETAFAERTPYHGIHFSIPSFRYSRDGNFSGTVHYEHAARQGAFELQISYRLEPILDGRDLPLQPQGYFTRVEVEPPLLHGLDPYEMIGEKIMACNRRVGGSGKDVYDLCLWAERPFDSALVRRVACLKAWTDQRDQPRFEPERFLGMIQPRSFRWTDLTGLVPHRLRADADQVCAAVRERFAFLGQLDADELALLADQTAHRERDLFDHMRADARGRAAALTR